MTTEKTKGVSRRTLMRIFAATAVTAAPTYSKAFGLLRNAGDIRRLKMYSPRSGESLDTIYWVDGNYIPEVLTEINNFMRDWRVDKIHVMAPRTLDIISATHRLLETSEPYTLYSGYRTPATNAWLHAHSSGVALHSLHMDGEAADLHMAHRSVSQIRHAAESCKAGGVGHYYRSGFVHMDCGPVRTWGG